ncbi:DUF6314 family protein [Singulisphaera rosea]
MGAGPLDRAVNLPSATPTVGPFISDNQRIRLKYLRFGLQNPVYLFDLVPESQRVLTSAEPHVCQEDRCSARMEVGDATVHLSWTVIGPRKDERIAYSYR